MLLTLFKDTSKKSLRGSYPNVENQKEFDYAVQNPEKSLCGFPH